MELLYITVLDDGTSFEFVSKDTLSHPIDFIEHVTEMRDEHASIATANNLNRTEVYGFFGHEEDVDICKTVLFEKAFGFSISDFSDHVLEQDESFGFFLDACAPLVREMTPQSNASYLQIHDDEAQFKLLMMTAGNAFPGKDECRLALEQFADAWIEQEAPVIFKRQVFTNAFLLNPLRGKRIIAPFFNPNDHEWELLLEGARRIRLNSDDYLIGQHPYSSVVGRWTEVDIEQILLTPAYGYGIHILPYPIAEEWVNALLYCCAISIYVRKWSLEEARSVYRSCLEMLKERLPYKTSDAIVDEDTFLQAFLQSAERTALSLRGIEESSLTRRFALEMPSRVYQLKTLMPILRQSLPSELAPPFKARDFDRQEFRALLASCEAPTASDKGMALENLAACMLGAVEGWLLAGRRVKADDCEIDLCFVNASLDQSAWDMGTILLVECKNRVEVSGVSVLRNLSFIMDAKGCRTGLIISMSGFSKVVIEQSARLACQEKYVLLIDGDDLDAVAAGMHPSDLVNAKYRALQKEVDDDLGLLY